MVEKDVRYEAGGVTLSGMLIDGSNGTTAPGVLVAHEAPGRTERMTHWARRLAEKGYVAFALDLYGKPASVEQAMPRYEEIMAAPGQLLERSRAALDVLKGQPNVDPDKLGVVGFCMGGIVGTELARAGAGIRCAIGFHPGLVRPAGSPDGPIDAKILMMAGDQDPVVPPELRAAFTKEMDEKGADWQLHLFGGVLHGYTNPESGDYGIPGFGYSRSAERRGWTMATALLEESFGG